MGYDTLYHEQVLDHYRHPRNKGTLEAPSFSASVFNPLCGDQVTMQATVQDDVVVTCVFQAKGCVISQAAASMVTELVRGKTIDEVRALGKDELLKVVNLQLGPNRLRCALIALEAVHNGLKGH